MWVALLVGCASDPPTALSGGSGIPITPEPTFQLPPEDHPWPPVLRRGKCIVVPDRDENVRDDELRAFTSAFQEAFFGKLSPFLKVDTDSLSAAAQRRQAMANLPLEAGLTKIATSEGADYAVKLHLAMLVRPRSQTGRTDVDEEIAASATCVLNGNQEKKGQEIEVTLEHPQLTNAGARAEMRLAHARVIGRLVANRMIERLSTGLGTAQAETWIDVTLLGFSQTERKVVKNEILPSLGVAADDIEERSAQDGSGQVSLRVFSTRSINAFQSELELQLVSEGGWRCSTSCAGQQIVVRKH